MNWIFIIAIVIVITFAVLYFIPSLGKKPVSSKDGPFLLAELPNVFASSDTDKFIEAGNASFQGYFYILPLDRTPTAMKCNEPGYPSCEDGRFDTCVCENSECANCVFNGYTNLISIGGIVNFQILGTPDAGRPGKAMAQLAVKTQNTDASGGEVDYSVEVLNLPAVPIQKWVMITIVKTGRRYDIYYNNELVSSNKTIFMIGTNAKRTKSTTLGDSRLSGYAGYVSMYSNSLSSADISTYYQSSSDTRGSPLLAVDLPAVAGGKPTGSGAGLSISGFVLNAPIPSLCPSGSCLEPPPTRPANPMYDWTTPYA
jgi:hypothetical protein